MKYYKYLLDKKIMLFAVALSVFYYYAVAYMFYLNNSPLIYFGFDTPIIIINVIIFIITFNIFNDLRDYKIINKTISLNKQELTKLAKYLLILTFILCFLAGQKVMISNFIIAIFLLLNLRNYYLNKVGPFVGTLLYCLLVLYILVSYKLSFDIGVLFSNFYVNLFITANVLIPIIYVSYNYIKAKRAKYNIKMTRDSISKSESNKEHSIKFEVDETTTYKDFITRLIASNYFPQVFGDDVVWVITFENKDMISYITRTDEIFYYYLYNSDKVTSLLKKGRDEFFVKYYHSPLKRAETIFKNYHEDYQEEYELYKINNEMERKWQK